MKPRITERQSLLAALLTAGLLAGCMVGPNYHRPAVQPPTAFRDLSDNPQAQAQVASYADLPWWQVFQDPQLQELMRVALKQNYDLLIATERINASRAQLAITKSNLFPQVSGNGNFTGGKEYNFQTKYNFLTTTADAAFQLDFFGKLRRADEAARAQLLGTEELGARGFIGATEFAEKIELERGVGGGGQKVVFGLEVILFATGEIAIATHLREEIGLCNGKLSAAGVNTLGGDQQVVVLL